MKKFGSHAKILCIFISCHLVVPVWAIGRLNQSLTKVNKFSIGADVNSVSFIAGGTRLFVGSSDEAKSQNHLDIYDITKGTRLRRSSHRGIANSMAVSPDGKTIAQVTNGSKSVEVWDLGTGNRKFILPNPKAWYLRQVIFSSDGQLIAAGGGARVYQDDASKIVLWDVKTRKIRRVFTNFTYSRAGVLHLAISPDKRLIAGVVNSTEGVDGELRVWSVQTGKLLYRIFTENDEGMVGGLAFSPDGKWLASAGSGIVFRYAETGKVRKRLSSAFNSFTSIQFSQDGKLLFAGYLDEERPSGVYVFDVRTSRLRQKLPANKGWINSLALSSNGIYLASGGSDHTVRLWRLNN